MSPRSRDYYENLARTYATQYGIDADIFVAQIGQESNFDPTAGSSAGAQGIAQIIPKYHPGVDPWDPDASLNYAAQLMAGQLQNYGGDIRKALTAYHAGPGILNRAIELGGADWEGSITAAANQLGFTSDADRIGRDNRTYLAVILGGGSLVGFSGEEGESQLFGPTLRGQLTDPQVTGNIRERLQRISDFFFGQPPDSTPAEPFPGFTDLVNPFERDMAANVNFREVIGRQLEGLAQESFELTGPLPVMAIPGPGGMARYPLSIIQGVWPWGGPLGEAKKERELQQEEINKQVNALIQQQSTLLAQYDDLSRFFTAVELQFIILQNEDPEIRTEAQSELDQLIATNSPTQKQMMEPVLSVINDEVALVVEQLSNMTPEEIATLSKAELTEKLFEDRRARPIASYLLSTEQLRLSLMGFRPEGPPDETTGEQLREMLMVQGLDGEEAQAYREDTLARVKDRIAEYEELERNIAALRAGASDWQQPGPGPFKYLKMMAIQPLLVASVALEKYFDAVPRPLAGITLHAASFIIPGEQQIEKDLDLALEDNNYWQAAGEAWRANTWHPVAKFAVETLADPTTYIGWGIATRIVKPLPILGRPLSRLVAAAEYGYLEMASAPFRIVGTGLRGVIKRPAAALGAMAGEQTMGDLMRLVTRANQGTKFSQITAEQATDTLAKALERGYQFPDGIGVADLGVIVSKALRAQAVPDANTIMGMVTRTRGTLTKESLMSSKTIFLDVETRLVAALDDPNKTGIMAQQLMTILGVEDTASGRGFAAMKAAVTKYVEAGESQAARLIQGDSKVDILNRIAEFTKDLTIRNHQSKAAIEAINQGRLTAMLSKGAEGTGAVWSGSIEKFMIRPLARSYLLFGMYHLWNVAETKGKAMLAGINPFFRGNRGQMYVNAWADSAGRRTEVLLGGGRGLMWGETLASVKDARHGMEKFLAPKAISRLFREELAIRIQAADQALINHKLALRELKRIRPKEWAAIDAARKAAGPTDFLPRSLNPWLDDATDAAILRGPQAIRELPGELTAEKLRAFNIEQMLGRYENIDSHIQRFIMGQAESGRLFTNTDEVGREVLDLVWEKHLRSPEFFASNFEEMAEEILTAPIASYEDLSKRLLTLQGMSRGYGKVLEHQHRLAKEASNRVVSFAEHDNVYNLWAQGSDTFSDRAGASLDTYINSVRQHLSFAGDKVPDVELLLNRVQALRDLNSSTWSKIRAARERIFGSMTKKERANISTDRWREIMGELGQPFADEAAAKEALTTSIYSLEARIGDQAKNPISDVTGRAISRADIATLYGGQPSEVAGMTQLVDLQAIMGRDDFTQEVVARALINLEPGQDLTKLGWTKESIGKVWDDIMREFRLDPDNVSAIAPTLTQVEDMIRGVRLEAMKADILTETVPETLQAKILEHGEYLSGQPGIYRGWRATSQAGATGSPETVGTFAASTEKLGKSYLDVAGEHEGGPLLQRVLIRAERPFVADEKGLDQLAKWQIEDSIAKGNILGTDDAGRPIMRGNKTPDEAIEELQALYRRWPYYTATELPDNVALIRQHGFDTIIQKRPTERGIEGRVIIALDPENVTFPGVGGQLLPEGATRPTAAGKAFTRWADDLATRLEKVEGYARVPISESDDLVTLYRGLLKRGRGVEGNWWTTDRELALNTFARGDPDRMIARQVPRSEIDAAVARVQPPHDVPNFREMRELASRGEVTEIIASREQPGTFLLPTESGTTPSFLQAKGEALESATTEFYRMFPDYVDLNYLDKFFRSQFPFWVYEWHRLWYLPRQFMRTPGLVTGMGRYNEATGGDNYIHVPFTSMEINPLRGTILMGGLRRLLIRDYPEFYDNLPWVQQALDISGRWGFYPGAHVTIGNLLFGTAAGPQWDQLGEIVPVWMKAPIQGFQAFAELTGNDTMIQAAKRLADVYVPERFRNYMIALKVSDIGAKNEETGEFVNGADLNSKMMAGTPLSEFEQELWDRATGELSRWFLLMDQTGLFRFRPEEKQQALEELDIIYSEYSGFSIEQLENMRKWDINPFDIIPPSPEVRDLLNATEYMQRWAGATNVLFGASEQQFRAIRNEFFTEVNKGYLDRKVRQEVIDCQWGFAGATSCEHPGSISSKDWNNARSELGAESRTFWDNLRAQERYRDVSMTMDDELNEDGSVKYEGLLSLYGRTGQALPVEHPATELFRMYFDIQLVEKFDPETGELAPDFDTLYLQQEIFLQTLGDWREELEPQIRESDTDLEKLRRWSYTQYLRPYYNRRDLTISRFPSDAQIIINKWLASDSPLERDQLETIQFGGRSLIGQYQEDLRRAGQRLRLYSPDIDSWVAFWGTGQHSFQTDEGQARYISLMKQYRPGRAYDLPMVSPNMLTISEEGADA